MSQPGQQKSKELKTVSKQVITPSVLNEDKRKLQLLYIIKQVSKLTEKSIITLLYELKQKGIDLGYQFNIIGNNVFSPMIKEDLTSLLYLGLIEIDSINKKISVSNNGLEVLEKNQLDEEFKNKLNQAINEIKTKIIAIDEEYNLKLKSDMKLRRR
ncbi:hypothetical protein BFU36_04895 [Sulfolobus sp. A20]|uniref:hypothetical protein n=1 Tax=Sulfolobaceae TaxID=118883 RepID=UPI000845DEDA|nr:MULTISPECIES: hypothetical protein [unclassified Sulfolobus]TRM73551.1 hypothetical protein DJ523_07080 [Sulfolobus sp. E5]TRM77072.1 hypothetical protein DJ528_07450 [Sulfolobus sp. B5]TRM77788.1 hypothetical protein DJ532_03305 [Sulfolobus sp. A20-N-F8]TRM84213.1 hypothetical protein DJ522_05265 [Sulfolobus sp. F3]TRM87545.1 hypothetical protein DJ529_08160 [Sulfolobus sp. C3]TRM94745.1 hypothetical protein DJ526_01845 [Sulfolobus sp. A20-N-G8]TRM96101.1 hypothetical protein DJ527_13015